VSEVRIFLGALPRGARRPSAAMLRHGQKPAIDMLDEESLMQLALDEAEQAGRAGDVPVGAVVVDGSGRVLGRGRNRREVDQDPTAHAEVLALRQASTKMGTWRLSGAIVFATLEPCPMCAGALVNARVERVVYGCDNPKAGAVKTLYRILEDERLNHRVKVEQSALAAECGELLTKFFEALRRS
jgi:tRNA(adenine34) deaminase